MKEFKNIQLKDIDLKFEGESRKFSGYASVFGGNDSYGDTVMPGAFTKTLAAYGMPKMFYGHQWGLPIGKWTSAVEDEKGLRVEGELTPGNPQADAVLAALKHGTVDGLSIGFSMRGGAQDEKKEGGRVIKSVGRLFEISVVSFPADGAARITEVRNRNLESFFKVPAILRVEREEVVFGMAGHENLPPAFRGKQKWTGAAARSKHSNGRNCGKIL